MPSPPGRCWKLLCEMFQVIWFLHASFWLHGDPANWPCLYHGPGQISYTNHLRPLDVVLDTIRSKDAPAVIQQFPSLNANNFFMHLHLKIFFVISIWSDMEMLHSRTFSILSLLALKLKKMMSGQGAVFITTRFAKGCRSVIRWLYTLWQSWRVEQRSKKDTKRLPWKVAVLERD